MQGYRGGNRQCISATSSRPGKLYLLGLLLTCISTLTVAQSLPVNSSLTWYVPKSPIYQGGLGTTGLIEYASLPELAEKLLARGGKSYHLTLQLEKPTSADWQVLRTIDSPTSLAIELSDTLMTDELMPIMAGWTRLERLEFKALGMSRQIERKRPTIILSSKNEVQFSFKPVLTKLPTSGWDKLKSVKQVSLDNELNLAQALTVMQALPSLETLSLPQYDYMMKQDITALAGLSKLKTLTVFGKCSVPAEVFKGLLNLTSLTVYDPQPDQLNEGLVYLKKLRKLEVHCYPPSALRLGTLPGLQTLHIHQLPYRSALIPNDPKAAIIAKQATRSLDSTLAGLSTLQRFTLEGMKLDAFPASLLANKGLTYLSIPDADLTDLPTNLDQLSALEELIIDNNPLHRLPAAVCRLTRLRWLGVSRCELDSLPANIGELTYLTNLSLNSNQLTALPASMGHLKKLTQLNVSMNQLAELPAELGTLPQLETVAAFWNKINRFPMALTQVRNMYLTDNQLAQLPASIGTMKRLRTLLLDNNPITSLPESIGQLDSLETLVLGGNQLTTLPVSIGSLKRLSRFTLGQNQVRALPESVGGLTSLTAVSIKDNPIDKLPLTIGNWQQLINLDLHLHQLEALPQTIGRLQQLAELVVESDRLQLLPTEVTDCGQLTGIAIAGKRFIGIPESLNRLTQLVRLTLTGKTDSVTDQGIGQVLALPASIAQCLSLIELTVQDQQHFDAVEAMQLVARLPRLAKLAFSNCGITDLTGVPWKNMNVSTLNLSKNRISQLPAALLDMPHLDLANFSENNLPAHLNLFFYRRSGLTEAMKKQNE